MACPANCTGFALDAHGYCAVLVIDQPDDGDPGEWDDIACSNTCGVGCETP